MRDDDARHRDGDVDAHLLMPASAAQDAASMFDAARYTSATIRDAMMLHSASAIYPCRYV